MVVSRGVPIAHHSLDAKFGSRLHSNRCLRRSSFDDAGHQAFEFNCFGMTYITNAIAPAVPPLALRRFVLGPQSSP
jgi:hypothetical protein